MKNKNGLRKCACLLACALVTGVLLSVCVSMRGGCNPAYAATTTTAVTVEETGVSIGSIVASFRRLSAEWWIYHIVLLIIGVVAAVVIMDTFHESRVIEAICLCLVCAFLSPLSVVIGWVIHNEKSGAKWNRKKEKEFEAGIEKLKAANDAKGKISEEKASDEKEKYKDE